MSKKEKGEFGYLKYKRSFNLLLTIIAFLIIAAVFVTGLIIFKYDTCGNCSCASRC